jgi:adenylate cyclase
VLHGPEYGVAITKGHRVGNVGKRGVAGPLRSLDRSERPCPTAIPVNRVFTNNPLLSVVFHPEASDTILAADVVGYSRLMGADEEGTHERLKAHLSELVEPKIAEHRGRTVKNTGDGFLAEFASVVGAVRCAAELQSGMADRNADIPEDKRIAFRIGINLGDVIADNDDIFGDGVNVAARLEALAEPGGICVSRVVRDQVRDRFPYAFEDMGEQSVKNIARPVRVFALRPEAIADLPATRYRSRRRIADAALLQQSRRLLQGFFLSSPLVRGGFGRQ